MFWWALIFCNLKADFQALLPPAAQNSVKFAKIDTILCFMVLGLTILASVSKFVGMLKCLKFVVLSSRIMTVLAVVLASPILISNWVFSRKEKGSLGKLWIMFGAAMICLVLASLFAFILRRQGGEQNQLEGRVPVDEQHQDGEESQGGNDDLIRKSGR